VDQLGEVSPVQKHAVTLITVIQLIHINQRAQEWDPADRAGQGGIAGTENANTASVCRFRKPSRAAVAADENPFGVQAHGGAAVRTVHSRQYC
jgi:hypothetical protein